MHRAVLFVATIVALAAGAWVVGALVRLNVVQLVMAIVVFLGSLSIIRGLRRRIGLVREQR